MSRVLTKFLVAVAFGLTACSSTDSLSLGGAESIVVKTVVSPGAEPNNGFYIPSETIDVTATVYDATGASITDANVDWALAKSQGIDSPAASITKTGAQTAQVTFSREGTVAITASAARSDGSKISSTVYLSWSRGY